MFASDLSFAVGKFCSHFHMIALQIFGKVSRTLLSLADFLFSRKTSLKDLFNCSPYSPPPITWFPCLLPSFSFPSDYFLVFKSPSSLFIMDPNISFRCRHWTSLTSVFFLLWFVGSRWASVLWLTHRPFSLNCQHTRSSQLIFKQRSFKSLSPNVLLF